MQSSLSTASRPIAALRRRASVALVGVLAMSVTAACGGDDGGGGRSGGEADKQITVWTLENLPDGMATQKKIVVAFTKRTGVKVKLVGVAEDQYSQLLTSAAASDKLPDVVALSLAGVQELTVNELHNQDIAAAVVEELVEDTFTEQALALTRYRDAQLSVPSDAWAQLLVYRKDLFAKAGLKPPDSYDAITATATELVTLANKCEMVDEEQAVTLDSPECAEAFSFYGALVKNHSVPGAQDVDTTRATYFAGRTAMVIWSSFILDELAGLRKDALPVGRAEEASSARYLSTVRQSTVRQSTVRQSTPHARGMPAWVAPRAFRARKGRMFIRDSEPTIIDPSSGRGGT